MCLVSSPHPLIPRRKELCDAVKKIQSKFRTKAFGRNVVAAASAEDEATSPLADVVSEVAADVTKSIEGAAAVPLPLPLADAVAAVAAVAETPTSPTSVDDELADIDMTDPDLAKAASKIQAKFRVKRK